MRIFPSAALLLVLAAPLALADGDAPERPASAAEKAFMSNALGTVSRALPAAPSGWKATEAPSAAAPANVYQGVEKGGTIRLRYKGKWFDQAQKEHKAREGQKAMAKAQPSEASMDSMQAEMEKIQADQQKAMDEMNKAAQKQDKEGMARAQKKLQAVQQRQQRLFSPMAAQSGAAEAASAVSDACLEVEVILNDQAVGLRKARPLSIPGAERAFLVDDGNKDAKDCPYGRAVAALGAWKSDTGGDYLYLRQNWREGMPHTSVKNVLVSVRASDERAKKFLSSVKWDALSGLVAR